LADKENRLSEAVFSYRVGKDGKVFIAWHGRTVTVLTGSGAKKFLAKVTGLSDGEAQLVMAKATGNFKRGNER
jgi:hypothetical protein